MAANVLLAVLRWGAVKLIGRSGRYAVKRAFPIRSFARVFVRWSTQDLIQPGVAIQIAARTGAELATGGARAVGSGIAKVARTGKAILVGSVVTPVGLLARGAIYGTGLFGAGAVIDAVSGGRRTGLWAALNIVDMLFGSKERRLLAQIKATAEAGSQTGHPNKAAWLESEYQRKKQIFDAMRMKMAQHCSDRGHQEEFSKRVVLDGRMTFMSLSEWAPELADYIEREAKKATLEAYPESELKEIRAIKDKARSKAAEEKFRELQRETLKRLLDEGAVGCTDGFNAIAEVNREFGPSDGDEEGEADELEGAEGSDWFENFSFFGE